MAERYTRVYTQQGQFYCPGAPIIIEAGALLKDNQTGKIIAQLKFKNISSSTIRALTVKISATDVTGAEVAGVDNFQYLDLNVSRDGEFGPKTPIVLPDATARSFTCQCISAVLGDKTIWNCTENTKWVPLPKPCALASKIGAPLAEQYKRDTMPKAQYIPVEHDGLWSCACGAMNHANEQVCHSCRGSKAALFGALNIEKLQANKKKHDDAIAAEKAAVAEAEKIRAAITKKIAVIVAVAIVLLIGVFVFTSEVIVPATKYDNAVSLMDDGKYEDAQEIFLELEDYQDAEAKYMECEWKKGLALYLSGERYQAEQIFGRLLAGDQLYPDYVVTELGEHLRQTAIDQIEDGNYAGALYTVENDFGSGVKNEIHELVYQKGIELLEAEKCQDAIKVFELLDGFKDSSDKINEAKQKINIEALEKQYIEALDYMQSGDYVKAKDIFSKLNGYKDSADQYNECTRILEQQENAVLYGKYCDAIALMDVGKYVEAIAAFEALNGYLDSSDKIAECKNILAKQEIDALDKKYDAAIGLMNAGKYSEAIAVFKSLGGYRDSNKKVSECEAIILENKYDTAYAALEAGRYKEARDSFKALGSYKDSNNLYKYSNAKLLQQQGNIQKAAIEFGKLKDFKDSKTISLSLWDKFAVRETLCAGYEHTVGLKENGTVVAVGYNQDKRCNVQGWTGIIAISAGYTSTFGLKADGTVIGVGKGDYRMFQVNNWTDIVAISVGADTHVLGLKADGTVIATGENKYGECNVQGWTDIIAISAGSNFSVGLKSDGTVVAVGYFFYDPETVSSFTNVVHIKVTGGGTCGVKKDGSVHYYGSVTNGEYPIFTTWSSIICTSGTFKHVVGLKTDGTVVACGMNYDGQCNVNTWTNIVAVSAGHAHTVGLKADGTVVVVGDNDYGESNVTQWTNIKVPQRSS